MNMLTGEKLLKAIREFSEEGTKLDLMRACGYTSVRPDGCEELLAEAFYEAIVAAKGGEDESLDEDEDEDEDSALPEEWVYLLGGQDEVDKTIEYGVMAESRTLNLLTDADDDRACIVALAKLRREYERDTKRPAIKTDPEVYGINPFTIADHGVQINIVTDDDDSGKTLFAYTVGNEFSEQPYPELLIFCNDIPTIDSILNRLSEALIDGDIEITDGEIVELVYETDQGLAKAARLQILSGNALQLCQENYACAVKSGHPIITVDLQDENGLFPGDEDYESEESIERPDFIPFPGSPSQHIALTSDKSYKIECVIDLCEPEFIRFSRASALSSLKDNIPNLFSFYPSAKTILVAFASIHKLLESGKATIEPEEVFEVYGILGLLGEMPLRLSLLSTNQLELGREYFGPTSESAQAVVLVDIPDSRGYFAWEKNAQDYVTRNFDYNFLPDDSAHISKISVENDFSMPSSPFALYDCLSCYIGFLENPRNDADDEGKDSPPSLATMRVLLNLLDELHPDTWDYDGSPDEIYKTHISFCYNLCKTYLVPKLAREWVENERLSEYEVASPDPYAADIWRLPPPSEIPLPIADQFPSISEWGDYYSDKLSFLDDVDWMQVKRTVMAAYTDSTDADEVELCRRIQAGLN